MSGACGGGGRVARVGVFWRRSWLRGCRAWLAMTGRGVSCTLLRKEVTTGAGTVPMEVAVWEGLSPGGWYMVGLIRHDFCWYPTSLCRNMVSKDCGKGNMLFFRHFRSRQAWLVSPARSTCVVPSKRWFSYLPQEAQVVPTLCVHSVGLEGVVGSIQSCIARAAVLISKFAPE